MEALTYQLTDLHRRIGVFRYSVILDDLGVRTPTDQFLHITGFVEHVLGAQEGPRGFETDEELESWVRSELETQVARLPAETLLEERPSVRRCALRARKVIDWDAFEDFSELLSFRCGETAYPTTARRLRRHGHRAAASDLANYASAFLMAFLPRAVRTFDLQKGRGHEAAWLATVFYRYVLDALLQDRRVKNVLSQVVEPARLASSGSDEPLEAAAPRLTESLDALPLMEREAILMYFGFKGPEATLEQIGRRLRISPYRSRQALLAGLARLTGHLGDSGVLSAQQNHVCRSLFRDGATPEACARELGLGILQVRESARSVLEAFRASLRKRTPTAQGQPTTAAQKGEVPLLTTSELAIELAALEGPPNLKAEEDGARYAELGGQFVRIEYIQDVLRDPDALAASGLDESRLETMDWLIQPDQRSDLEPMDPDWEREIERTWSQSRADADTLYACVDEALVDAGEPGLEGQKEEVRDQLHTMMRTAAATIQGSIPHALLAEGHAILCVSVPRSPADEVETASPEPTPVVDALWEADRASEAEMVSSEFEPSYDLELTWRGSTEGLSFRDLIESLTSQHWDQSLVARGLLVQMYGDALLDGRIGLPGLKRADLESAGRAFFEWTSAVDLGPHGTPWESLFRAT